MTYLGIRACDYRHDEDGNISSMFAVSLTLIIMCFAVSIDIATSISQKSKLQDAADTAALAGAVMFTQGLETGQEVKLIQTNVKHLVKKLVHGENDTTFPGYKSKIKVFPDTETVQIDLQVGVPHAFSSIFSKRKQAVAVNSEATVVYRTDMGNSNCLYVMDPSASKALTQSGSSQINAVNCSVQVHSTSATAISNSGSAFLTSNGVCVTGYFSGVGYSPQPTAPCNPAPDPYASLEIPEGGVCDYNKYSTSDAAILSPGVYCGGLKVSGASVTLQPGEYFIRDGALDLSGAANLSGAGVVFILEGKSAIKTGGSSGMQLTPPDSGTLIGFNIVESRSADPGQASDIAGSGTNDVSGIIYAPTQNFKLSGDSDTGLPNPKYGVMVVNKLETSGAGTVTIEKEGETLQPRIKDNVRLVE